MAPTSSVKSREHDAEEKRSDHSTASPESSIAPKELVDNGGVVVAETSRGVIQMNLLKDRLDTKYKILLYGGFALLAYVMSLGTFQ